MVILARNRAKISSGRRQPKEQIWEKKNNARENGEEHAVENMAKRAWAKKTPPKFSRVLFRGFGKDRSFIDEPNSRRNRRRANGPLSGPWRWWYTGEHCTLWTPLTSILYGIQALLAYDIENSWRRGRLEADRALVPKVRNRKVRSQNGRRPKGTELEWWLSDGFIGYCGRQDSW